MSESRARYGWESDFPDFKAATPSRIRERLREFVDDASPEQIRAWTDSIGPLQREVEEVLVRDSLARSYSTILEYELPMESRRPDVILLIAAQVMVVELKGKERATQADIDQVEAYARDLLCYHRECADRTVTPVLVPTRANGYQMEVNGVHVTGPDALDELVATLSAQSVGDYIDRAKFLAESAYCPLPTLVEAARELFTSGDIRTIHRARAATDPAVDEIARICHQAALTNSRHLILLTGVPGAGKTLVGLRTVHAHYLDDLAVPRTDGTKGVPAVFLSGNGPLVEVLQYELRRAGGDGKTFVRRAKDYVTSYSTRKSLVPDEHVIVFDEAQRAFDTHKMRETHKGKSMGSEPDQLIEFASRIPEWCVVLGLIGSGQEIHVGEEGGLGQWREAIESSEQAASWTIHAPPTLQSLLTPSSVPADFTPSLNLDEELRFHSAQDLHRFVTALLSDDGSMLSETLARRLASDGYHLRLTRDLDTAKRYLRSRYHSDKSARFGLIASSKDRDLESFGVPNDYQATKRLKYGPWYADDEDDYSGASCRLLKNCITEFGAQGLELDACLLAWGTDFIMQAGKWSNARARGYKKSAVVRDPFQLRLNAYRVLLTRARDACVMFVPELPMLDETYEHFVKSGFSELE